MAGLGASLSVVSMGGILVLAGCGGDGAVETQADDPEIVASSPEDGSVDVNLNPLIQVWFDQEMEEATIDSAGFHVAGGTTERIEYDASEKAMTLYLSGLLNEDTTYEVVVDSTLTNTEGVPLAQAGVFSFTTGPMDCDHLEDYLEANQTIANAAAIDLVKSYPLLSSCGDGYNEYYEFVLKDTARVTARIEHVYSQEEQAPWYFRYKRASDEAYASYIDWLAEDKDLNYRHTFLPGTYYIEMGSGSGGDDIVVYDFILQLSTPCSDDSLEDNDFVDQASPIDPGLMENLKGCFRDRDCYSIRLVHGNALTASVSQTPSIGSQCTFEILGPNGNRLTGDDYTDYPAVEVWTADEDTVYYISATWWADNVNYSIEVDVVRLP